MLTKFWIFLNKFNAKQTTTNTKINSDFTIFFKNYKITTQFFKLENSNENLINYNLHYNLLNFKKPTQLFFINFLYTLRHTKTEFTLFFKLLSETKYNEFYSLDVSKNNYSNPNYSNMYTSFFEKTQKNEKLPINFYTTFTEGDLNEISASKLSFFYLRKTKIFNKSRYSRNRQIYRTGVYLCLWVNIIAIVGIYFIFYRFLFNFGYLWWIFFFFVSSFFVSSFIKYNLYRWVILKKNNQRFF